ncbi:hypothetical protein BDP27DRAFT_1317519 [Rhodocollybia butyracea]|uniref:Uncharacterized protein n=1 Tax=Rhodocollybia butyracea TaxID=206335 RepID=A0A9P5Q609_9AGAR|nr:hypothetical protein BDP27DRAFT_1317519 [Rhodocollybia butyracea]
MDAEKEKSKQVPPQPSAPISDSPKRVQGNALANESTQKSTTRSPAPTSTLNGKSKETTQSPSPGNPSSKLDTFLTQLPPWISTNLRKSRSLKVWFRCWLASWVAFLILLPNASSNTLGTAGFFALLCSFFIPANLPVQLFAFSLFTLVIGLCFSWGIGVAAMRAANAVRSTSLIEAVELQIQESIKNNPVFQANPALATTTAVFSGDFLDVRASAIYGCFLGFFTFFYALFRAYRPRLVFTSIFATIGIDIFCTFGPLFPTAQYTILNSFIISIGCYAAIALVVTLFVFPETMSHSALRSVCEQLERVEKVVVMQGEVLRVIDKERGKAGIEELAPGKPLAMKLEGMKAVMVGIMKMLYGTAGMISLEFSYGKWSSDDVKDVIEPLASVVARSVALQSFPKLVWRTKEMQRQGERGDEKSVNDPTSTMTSTSTKSLNTSNDAHLLQQITSLNAQFEASHKLGIHDIFPLIDSATADLRNAIVNGVAAVRKNLDNINRHRWTKNPEVDGKLIKELDRAYDVLTAALREFTKNESDAKRMQILGPFLSLLEEKDKDGGGVRMTKAEQEGLPFRSLFIAFVLGTNLVSLSESILKTMDIVQTTIAKRKRNRLWAPKGLRKIGNMIMGRVEGGEDENAAAAVGDDQARTEEDAGNEGRGRMGTKGFKLDPDSRPPTNVVQKIMNNLHILYRWCGTPKAMFAFKYSFVSVALWLPAVVNSTGGFYYKEKGLWALIMAQTTLNIYAADQVFNIAIRLIGTFIGATVGLVAWYMGNGHGIGNPFGAAVVTALFLLPLVFLRNFTPPQVLPGVLLGCATFSLVIGYSWVDGHIAQFATPGIGWSIAWKRFTLVVIGSAASFIVMMLPPTSGRKAVRSRNASIIASLGNLYAFLMSTWIAEVPRSTSDAESDSNSDSSGLAPENPGEKGNKDPANHEAVVSGSISHTHLAPTALWLDEFRVRLLGLSEEITTLRQLTATATWEGSVRGKWPLEEYNALLVAESEMLIGLAQLGNALAHLDDEWRITFMHNTRVLNPHFITDVMTVFSLVSQSLRNGEPLHQVLPQSLVGRLMYHHYNHHYLHQAAPRDQSGQYLTVDTVSSLDYMYYATGVVAVFLVLRSVDELHKITKKLCGEVPFQGFESWRNHFESEHVQRL